MKKTYNQKKYSILFSDDNRSFSRSLIDFIQTKFKNANIVYTDNGEEILKLTDEIIPDLIILDISMPGMSSFQITQKVKRNYPFIPVIFLTNYDENEYRLEAKKVMADAFILKRNIISELPQVISALLSSQFIK